MAFCWVPSSSTDHTGVPSAVSVRSIALEMHLSLSLGVLSVRMSPVTIRVALSTIGG